MNKRAIILLFVFSGILFLVVSFVAQWGVDMDVFRVIGSCLLSAALGAIVTYGDELLREEIAKRKVSKAYKFSIRPNRDKPSNGLPILIASDIDGCITPPYRDQVNPLQIAKLRAYCQFAANFSKYPPLVFFTGRSQGYVELLAQLLDIVDCSREKSEVQEVPFVIENGAALYLPRTKKQ
jgi:hypothetical protein